MIKGVHHVAISTADLDRSLNFYRDLLGFKEVFRSGWPVGSINADKLIGLENSSAEVVMLCAGNSFLELFKYFTPKPEEMKEIRPVCDHGITHICLQVDDIEEMYHKLISAGILFHSPPQKAQGGLTAAYGRDPDGNVFELLQVSDAAGRLALKP